MTLKWRGKEQLNRVLRATVDAMDETTEAIANAAEARVRRRTGDLARSIGSERAEVQQNEVTGRVGAGEFYGLFEEINAPFLRPAADSEVPQFKKRLADRLK